MNKIISFFKTKELYLFVVRYYLAMEMMGYGMLKIIGLQTRVMQPVSVWQYPLEAVHGTYLTWAFLGYSHWFAVLLGLFEFVPSALLLFRRTMLPGAMLLFPMTLSVCLVNFALHLWTITQRLSLILVLLNILIFVFEWKRVRQIFAVVTSRAVRFKFAWVEVSLAILAVAAAIFFTAFPLHPTYNLQEQGPLIGDWTHKHQNEWDLVYEKVNDSTLPYHSAKCYFGPIGIYCEINDYSINKEDFIRYSADREKHTLTIDPTGYRGRHRRADRHYVFTGEYSYKITGDSMLTLQKIMSDSALHTWTFRRRVMNAEEP